MDNNCNPSPLYDDVMRTGIAVYVCGVLRIYRSRRANPRIMASHHRAGRMLWRNTPM